ncbi:MAG: type II toxin-antitoxin system RelE/ParE family toxin [Thermoleophilia bacterium]
MKVRYLWDGEQFSLYALEFGDEHDFAAFAQSMRRQRLAEWTTMIHRLERLANSGIGSKSQNFNHLGDGLWEAKTHGGLRVTFFQRGLDVYVVDSCFAKSSRKTPPADLARAQERRRQFLERLEAEDPPPILMRADQKPRRTFK